MLLSWRAPGGSEEYAIGFGPGDASARILILPAWFDESNKLRHFTIEVMRALDARGVATILPDMPGCNESEAKLDAQDIESWRTDAVDAAQQFACTHVLAIRAGANIAPHLPGWAYAALAGKSALRGPLRARVIAAREAGLEERREDLLERGRKEGLELAGYRLGPRMIAQLAEADLPPSRNLAEVRQADLGGAGLWLRMEPDHDPAQAMALADRICGDLAA